MAKKKTPNEAFKRSWIDRFYDWVERLPIPFWLFYALVYLTVLLLQHLLAWTDGTLDTGTVSPSFLLHDTWLILLTALGHTVRRNKQDAIERFRPVLKMKEADFQNLNDRFIYLPERVGLWVLLLLPTSLWDLPQMQEYLGPVFFGPITKWFTTALLIISTPFNFLFFYSVFGGLIWINRLYAKIQTINLFVLTPLYAFSVFTSRLGILFILAGFLSSLQGDDPSGVTSSYANFYMGLYLLMGVLSFILPLRGIHLRLVDKKDQSLAEIGQRLDDAFRRLLKEEASGKLEQVGGIRQLIDAIIREREYIAAVPTWPWNPGTLRTFVTALAVPMTVWIV
jgi:hypothetical protein